MIRNHPAQIYALQFILLEHENILGPAGVLAAMQDAIVSPSGGKVGLTIAVICPGKEPHSDVGGPVSGSCPLALSSKTMGSAASEHSGTR